jgi:hypothetical protein
MEPADVANLIAGGALGVSVFAIARGEMTRRGSKEQAAKADAAAEKSAAAAERSATALEKMAEQWADSMSRAEKRDQRQWTSGSSSGGPGGDGIRGGGPWEGLPPSGGPPEPLVHWTVDRIKGRQHMLRNLGHATAHAVELRSENAARFDGPKGSRDLQMGEAVEFLAIGSMQTGTPELVVSWQDTPDGERREWRRPLP